MLEAVLGDQRGGQATTRERPPPDLEQACRRMRVGDHVGDGHEQAAPGRADERVQHREYAWGSNRSKQSLSAAHGQPSCSRSEQKWRGVTRRPRFGWS